MADTVKIDIHGKVFIPKAIRDLFPSNEFEILIKEKVVELIPVKNPLDLFGTLKSFDMSTLDEIHSGDHELDT